jgi:outer membrane protein TolC
VAHAKADVAARGLVAVVVQDYYAMAVAERKLANARQALREAQQFLSVTQQQESGGEAAHSDVIKAQIQVEQRQRDAEDAQLALDKARLAFAVLLFPDFRQDFSVEDDLDTASALRPFPEVQEMAGRNNPDMRAAQATVAQQTHAVESARAALLPALSFDYFFGINANQFAVHDAEQRNNLGSVAQAQLTVPLWNWGAARSKIRQAQIGLEQARNDLSFAQRELLSTLQAFYQEAQVAASQVDSLKHSADLSAESLRLTLLRYQAGEVTVLEVVDAQTTLTQARNARDDGLVRYRLALANLQTLTGAF